MDFNCLPMKINQYFSQYKSSFSLLLILNGLLGAFAGVLTATWQAPIETAQVLIGLVKYDPGSIQYAYHSTVFSLLNYIGVILLYLTDSEFLSSILLSALLGILAVQSLAMVIFLVWRNVYAAFLISSFLLQQNFNPIGISYPILFLGTEHAYGRAGLSFTLFAVLFLGYSKYRMGLFLSGLALAVHPAWGLWLNVCLVMTFAIYHKKFKNLVNIQNLISYGSGIVLFMSMYLWHKMYFTVPADSTLVSSSQAREIFLNYIKYWDYHRQKFDDIKLLGRGFYFSFISLTLSLYFIVNKKKEITTDQQIFFSTIIISTLSAIIFVFIPSWFDQETFPESLIILMPGRFINLSIFVCVPLLMATIPYLHDHLIERNKINFFKNSGVVLLILIVIPLFLGIREIPRVTLFGLIIYTTFNYGLNKLKKEFKNIYIIYLIVIIGLYLNIFNQSYNLKQRFPIIELKNKTNGLILTTMENYLVQNQIRAGAITPHLDGYLYGGKGPVYALNRMVEDLFGLSLLSPPPLRVKNLHGSIIASDDFKDLWESRKCQEWEQLSSQYHFGLVLVPKTFSLLLPIVDRGTDSNGKGWIAYKPHCLK